MSCKSRVKFTVKKNKRDYKRNKYKLFLRILVYVEETFWSSNTIFITTL